MLGSINSNSGSDQETLSHQIKGIPAGPLADYIMAKKVQKAITEPEPDRWKDYLARGSMVDKSV